MPKCFNCGVPLESIEKNLCDFCRFKNSNAGIKSSPRLPHEKFLERQAEAFYEYAPKITSDIEEELKMTPPPSTDTLLALIYNELKQANTLKKIEIEMKFGIKL